MNNVGEAVLSRANVAPVVVLLMLFAHQPAVASYLFSAISSHALEIDRAQSVVYINKQSADRQATGKDGLVTAGVNS